MIESLRSAQAILRGLLEEAPLDVRPRIFAALQHLHGALVLLDAVTPEDDGCV
jgi:hypothetical protein